MLDVAQYKDTPLKPIENLINAGTDVNAKNNNGRTALMLAAYYYKNPEAVIKALINAGADIFAKDNEGKTILDYAKTDEVKRIILEVAN